MRTTPRQAQQLVDSSGLENPKLPLVLFPGGDLAEAPTNQEIAEKVGLRTRAENPFHDLIVVGAGPSGMAAAVYGASEGLRVLLVERDAPGGQAGMSSRIENYLGFPVGLSGGDLTRRAVAQARRFGAELLSAQEVVGRGIRPIVTKITRSAMLVARSAMRSRLCATQMR